jgi:uncharacterized protein CbrC (UPF0167 family)
VCGRAAVWLYDGGVYAAGAPAVCARCLADGSLSRHLEHDFSLHDADFADDVDEALDDEVMQRTPGFSTFNPFTWPVMDGKPMAFVGHGDEDATWDDPAAAEAVRRLYAGRGEPMKAGETTPYAIVFREVDGDRHVAIVDFD